MKIKWVPVQRALPENSTGTIYNYVLVCQAGTENVTTGYLVDWEDIPYWRNALDLDADSEAQVVEFEVTHWAHFPPGPEAR